MLISWQFTSGSHNNTVSVIWMFCTLFMCVCWVFFKWTLIQMNLRISLFSLDIRVLCVCSQTQSGDISDLPLQQFHFPAWQCMICYWAFFSHLLFVSLLLIHKHSHDSIIDLCFTLQDVLILFWMWFFKDIMKWPSVMWSENLIERNLWQNLN